MTENKYIGQRKEEKVIYFVRQRRFLHAKYPGSILDGSQKSSEPDFYGTTQPCEENE